MASYIWTKDRGFVPKDEYERPPSGKRSDLPCPEHMRSFDSYTAPVTDEAGVHYKVTGRKEQARLMNETGSIPAQDVSRETLNENVRKSRGIA